ncbi:MAG: FtsK/SpoIIIE domain-containing protein, partial [Ilumatobacteraceae bacterium]
GVRDRGDVDHRAVGTDDGRAVPARLVVIVDEVAALLEGRRDAAVVLTDIARRGRSLGMHLVLATQRPAGVIPEALAANIDIRVALRVRDSADSVDVLGDPMAARIPREVPGRAVLRIGGDIPVPVQTARSTDDDIAAVRRRWVERPVIDLPWHPPLPDELDVGPGCPPDEHGLIDRPEHREQPPLTWAPGDGSLALVGAVGSGTTQALITVTARLCDAQVYVLDARGDRRLDDLARRPHVAPVVRIGDTERVGRLVERLRVEIAARRRVGGADSLGRVVLAIDGLEEVRRTADDLPGRVADSLDRVLAEGPAVGIVTVATAAGSPPSRLQMTEWTFTGRPGRIRLTGPDGVVTTAQVALVSRDDGPADGCHAPAPTPIGVLPETVDPTVVGGRRTEAGVALTIGIGADSLDPGGIVVPDGDHVLVLGPDRSGRSAVLDVLVAAWGDAQAGATARITRVTGGTSDVPVVDGPHLVVIDDAARVDDPSGEFAARLEAGEPGLTVCAPAHADALRARFGHWTQVVRRSRLGIVLSSAADGDGDLLGASLPGRPAMAPRPGLVWLGAEGSVEQLQVAAPTPVARRLR